MIECVNFFWKLSIILTGPVYEPKRHCRYRLLIKYRPKNSIVVEWFQPQLTLLVAMPRNRRPILKTGIEASQCVRRVLFRCDNARHIIEHRDKYIAPVANHQNHPGRAWRIKSEIHRTWRMHSAMRSRQISLVIAPFRSLDDEAETTYHAASVSSAPSLLSLKRQLKTRLFSRC